MGKQKVFLILKTEDKKLIMSFRNIFEELHWELHQDFESIMSIKLRLLRNSLFPKDVAEKDMRQNVPKNNTRI